MTNSLPPYTLIDIDTLKPYPRNARTHSNKQIGQIADSIKEFGFTNPVLIDGKNQIIAGHGRLQAARLIGLTDIPTLLFDHLSEAQKRAYILADNKIAENAGWDFDILAIELENLIALNPQFEIELTGFDTPEIDIIIGDASVPDDDDEAPTAKFDEPAISRPGDTWLLGKHRLFCGDACQADAYKILLSGKMAQMVFTDPPYNVPIDGHVSGLGKVKHKEFAFASGEMSSPQFTDFLSTVFSFASENTINGSIHFVCMDWRHLCEITAAGSKIYNELKNLCIWNKTNGGMGSLYRSKHELIFVYKNGKSPHINNVELGRHGRYRTNVWDYAGANTFSKDRNDDLAMHPTVKPVAMIADAILDCSKRNGLILDPFGGSGSTLIAAEKTGRRARLIELEPHYVDVIIKRWQALKNTDAVLEKTSKTFNQIAKLQKDSNKRGGEND